MKRPTAASLKKVTPENLRSLGAERLAEILIAVADTRPEVKRRLRMELAAEQGAEHLAVEIDKRLGSLSTSRSKVSWRQRPTFVRDLEVLRALIVERLEPRDHAGATQRIWLFMDLATPLHRRVRDRDGELEAVFGRAAANIGALAAKDGDAVAVRLAEAALTNAARWTVWLPRTLETAPEAFARAVLAAMGRGEAGGPGWAAIVRQLADASNDVDLFMSSFSGQALRTPAVAAEVAARLLAAARVDEAGQVLHAAQPRGPAEESWTTAWIDYLERSGQGDAAQAARWASFEATLSVDRARSFTKRLTDFEDVEAETRAWALAARHADFGLGLRFLMDWPALAEASRMIQARPDEAAVDTELAELWAGRLRTRHPAAARILLRKAAAAAFRRRQFTASTRLTQEADALEERP